MQNDKTLYKYSSTFSKYLIALLRSTVTQPMEYKFPLRKEQVKLAQDLFNQIEAKRDLQASIHQFSLSLFSTPPISKDINRWKCPLLCYLAVDNLKDDGSFKDAHHLTSFLAHWEYIIRGVCLYEAKETASICENGIIGYFYYKSSLFRSSLNMFYQVY